MPDNGSLEDAIINRVMSQMDEFPDAMAARMGMPPGGKNYSEADQLKMATFSPVADPHERMQVAMSMLQQGATVEDVTDHLYPDLRKLVTTGRRRIDEQIAFAKTLRGQIDTKMPTHPQEPPPVPPAPMLSQPMGMAPQMPAPAPPQMPQPAPMAPAPQLMMQSPVQPQQQMPTSLPAFDSTMIGG